MSMILLAMTSLFFVVMFSQFGGRIRASNALAWWLVAAFLLVALVDSRVYLPITQWFGIQVVSNFIIAGLLLFLMYQVIELNALHTLDRRKYRMAFCKLAARQLLARRAAGPAAPGGPAPRVLVVLPCFNEEASIPPLAAALTELAAAVPFALDFCFVDDASADGTNAVLQRTAPQHYAEHLANLGVGAVLLTGFHAALALGVDFVVQCDGDGQHPIAEIPQLVAAALRGDVDLVVGSRFLAPAKANGDYGTTALRRVGSGVIRAVLRLLWPASRCTDPTSGFRLYSQRAMRMLLAAMPDEYPEPETMALAYVTGLRVEEIPVAMLSRTAGVSTIAGIKSFVFMYKVLTALVGLRLRSLSTRRP